jgi:streptogramin lyase
MRIQTLRQWCVPGAVLAGVMGGAACSSGPGSGLDARPAGAELTGTASADLELTPVSVHCITIQVTNGTTTVSRTFSVSPETSSTFALAGLPLGTDTFQASASTASCGDAGAAPAVFTSSPVTVSVAAGVTPSLTLTMQPVTDGGAASVGVNFPAPTSGVITEFPLPAGFQATGIAAGPDGNLWVTSVNAPANLVARVTTAGVATVFPAGFGGNQGPITTGSDGNLWFTESSTVLTTPPQLSQLSRITPEGTGFVGFPYGTNASNVDGLTVGPDGSLWVVDTGQNAILHVSISGELLGQFAVPTAGALAANIALGSDGNLWFTENGFVVFPTQPVAKVGRLSPAGAFVEFPVQSQPFSIAAGPDGNLWVTLNPNSATRFIGKITTLGALTQFAVPSPNPLLLDIAAGPDGNVWFIEGSTPNNIGRIKPDGTITEFAIPTPNSNPRGIAVGPDGNVWFGEGVGKIGRITP